MFAGEECALCLANMVGGQFWFFGKSDKIADLILIELPQSRMFLTSI
jgi:hypothetical protein